MATHQPLVIAAAREAAAFASRLPAPAASTARKASIWQTAVARLLTVHKEAAEDVPALRAAVRGFYIAMPLQVCQELPQAAAASYDALLRAETQSAAITEATSLPTAAPGIAVWQGDMSRLRADAVVNPGNNALLGCFLPEHKCLDNILHGASGPQLRIACGDVLRRLNIDEDVNGQCRVTPGFALPATWVFHTVGPCLVDPRNHRKPPRQPTAVDRKELEMCYRSCLGEAKARQLESIAFCCISTGIFGYPAEEAAQIAVATVLDERARCAPDEKFPLVIFNVFKDEDLAIYSKVVPDVAGR